MCANKKMETINIRIKNNNLNEEVKLTLVLLEPIDTKAIETYHYDIRTLSVDLDIVEIEDDLHMVYVNNIDKFYDKHSKTKYRDIAQYINYFCC